MPINKGAIAAIAGGAVAAVNGNLATITTAGLHAAAATQIGFSNVAGGTKAAINAAGGAVGGFINNGINLLSKGTVVAVAVGTTVAVAGATVIVPAVGFTVAGVKAGTLAAAAHGAIGNVAAGSLFASLQSAGVLGLAAITKVAIGIAGGTAGVCIKNKFL